MKRAWLVVVLISMPVLGGFECTITDGDSLYWIEGDRCSYFFDASEQVCDGDKLLYCDTTDYVVATDCSTTGGTCAFDAAYGYDTCVYDTWQPGAICSYVQDADDSICSDDSTLYRCTEANVVEAWDCGTACAGGFCGEDTREGGWDWCLCPDWAWAEGYSCNYLWDYDDSVCDGDILVYCSDVDVIGEISCNDQCASTYGAGTLGTCGVQDDTGYNGCNCVISSCNFEPVCSDSYWLVQCGEDGLEYWTDCNSYCGELGFSKGVCDKDSCLCA